MLQSHEQHPPTEGRVSPFAWPRLLRTSCAILSRAPAETHTATRITGVVGEGATRPEAVVELGRRIAEEYGLKASGRIEGRSFSIRFTRPPAAADLPTLDEAPRVASEH